MLNKFLGKITGDDYRRKFVRRKTLCHTIAGNEVEQLLITNHQDTSLFRNRKAIVISARVHPGENMASYVMQGIIWHLTGPSLQAKLLRDNFLVFIVPMLNIDGVVVGNYRTNLASVDLNRQWAEPSKKNHPSIFYTKQLIKRVNEERDLFLYCDLHGHNRKKNIFICRLLH